MKILHIISNIGRGGAETTLLKILENDKNNQHYLISLKKNGQLKYRIEKLNINIFETNLNILNILNIFKIFKHVKKINPDLIQSWMYHSDFISLLIKIFYKYKIVWCVRSGFLNFSFRNFQTIFIRFLCAKLSKNYVDKIIYCSENSMKYHHKIGYNNTKSVLIPNGYDIEYFRYMKDIQSTFINSEKLSKNTLIIGIVGRIHNQKNHIFFLKLLNNLINYKKRNIFALVIYPEQNKAIKKFLNRYIQNNSLNENIKFINGSKNINQYLNILDLNIVCSKWGEAFPNVVCETMLCKVINISFNIGDAKQIINNDDLVINNLDIDEFTEKILELYDLKYKNKTKWNQLRENSRQRIIENYKLDFMTKKFNNTWSNVLYE